jgi:hypothetical protein
MANACGPAMTCVYVRQRLPDVSLVQRGAEYRRSTYRLDRKTGWVAISHREEPVAAWEGISFGEEANWQWVRGPKRSEWLDGTTGRLAIRWLPERVPAGQSVPPLHGDPDAVHPVFEPWADFTLEGAWGEISPVRLNLLTTMAMGQGSPPSVAEWKIKQRNEREVALERSYGREGVGRDGKTMIKRASQGNPLYRCVVTIAMKDGPPRIVKRELFPDDDRIDPMRWEYDYHIEGSSVILKSSIFTIQPGGHVLGRVAATSIILDREPPDSAFHIDPSQAKTVYDETARMAIDVNGP